MPEATRVGLKNVYYALLTADDISTVPTYGTPVYMAPAIMAKFAPKSSSSVLYADNGAAESATSVGETEIELELKNIPLTIQAALLGHTLAGGVITRKTTDVAPYVAVGFESVKSNGTKRYVWLFKVRFEVPDEDYKTKGDKVDFQTQKIKGTGIKRDYDDAYSKMADEEDPGYIATVGSTWFTTVQGAADTTAPTISSIVPAAAATGVAVGTTAVWTFSEAIQWVSATDAAGKFGVFNDTTGAAISGVLSINAAKTIVTFTPSANLAATTAHRTIATVGVKDIAGNALAANSVTKFTTA